MLRNKGSLNKFKKNEIISSIFSYHNATKLEVNYKKKAGKVTNMWRLKKILLNNKWITEETKGEIKKNLETNGNENTPNQLICDAAKVVLRGKFIVM